MNLDVSTTQSVGCVYRGVGWLEREGLGREWGERGPVRGLQVNPRELEAGCTGRSSQMSGAILPSSHFLPALGRCFLPQSLCHCLGRAAPSPRPCFHSQHHPSPHPHTLFCRLTGRMLSGGLGHHLRKKDFFKTQRMN